MNYIHWQSYFEANRTHFNHINWQDTTALTLEEKKLISASLQQFQQGEHSEGKHFLAFAGKFDPTHYLESVRFFIREEQQHALQLGRFMDMQGILRIRSHWVDKVFRRLRSLSGVENTVMVLLTAEIIGKIYYQALLHATGNALLKSLCQQICKDEEQHIAFQSVTLRHFYRQRKTMGKLWRRLFHRLLMTTTMCVVWVYHRRVLKKGGFSFSVYKNAIETIYHEARKNIEACNESNYENDLKPYSKKLV